MGQIRQIVTPIDQQGAPLAYTQGDRGDIFYFALKPTAPAVLAAGASATVAGFALVNPTGSLVNLIIRSLQMVFNAPPAAAATMFYAKNIGANPTATSQTNINQGPIALKNQSSNAQEIPYTPSGIAYSSCTLSGVPTAIRYGQSVLTGAANIQSIYDDEIQGQIILEPGTQLTVQATAAISSVFFSGVWEEFPIW